LVTKIRSLVDKIDTDAGHHKRSRRLQKDLLTLIATGSVPTTLRALQKKWGMKKPIAELERAIASNEFAIPKALHATQTLDWTPKQATKEFGQVLRVVREAQNLGGKLGVLIPELVLGSGNGRLPAFATELEDRLQHVEVVLEQRAVAALVLPAIEAYMVPKNKKDHFTEVGGICFGHAISCSKPTHGKGEARRTCFHVEFCTTELRARMTEDEVHPSPLSERVLDSASGVLLPHLEFLGGFHSHPYKRKKWGKSSSMAQMKGAEGWDLSEGDRKYLRREANGPTIEGKPPRLEIVVTVAEMKRLAKPGAGYRHTFPFCVGRLRVILAAYHVRSDGEARPVDRLVCHWRSLED